MSNIILPSAYFGPVDYFAHAVQASEVQIEVEDNFQKQTYRNRCYIFGANGKLMLNVPLKHSKNSGVKQKSKDVLIANDVDWKKIHWKSIDTAYRTSPFFEYYEDDLRPFFEKKHKYMLDLSLESFEIINDIVQLDIDLSKTNSFEKKYEGVIDLRESFNAKSESSIELEAYRQVFSDKLGFIKNLSVLDLLFCEGPNTESYLRSVIL